MTGFEQAKSIPDPETFNYPTVLGKMSGTEIFEAARKFLNLPEKASFQDILARCYKWNDVGCEVPKITLVNVCYMRYDEVPELVDRVALAYYNGLRKTRE